MNKEDIKKYFDLYVNGYQPYKDIPQYQAIVNTIVDFYFNHSYNELPLPFKKAFESQVIPTEFYNELLLSIGYPKEIVSNLIEKDKKILLNSFMDYNRYKGTIEQIRKIGNNFLEKIGIYELFIDLRKVDISTFSIYCIVGSDVIHVLDNLFLAKINIDDTIEVNNVSYRVLSKNFETNDVIIHKVFEGFENPNLAASSITDFVIKRWCFVPDPIYVSDIPLVTKAFDYLEIYKKTKRYFVTTEQLYSEYFNKNLVLPIKSNLIFLDYLRYSDASWFNNLLSAIVLKEYYDERLTILFKDGAYSTTLGKAYKIWYYILMKFFNYDFVDMTPTNIIMLNIDHFNFIYTVDDIKSLIDEYSFLNSTADYSLFYHSKMTSVLKINNYVKNDLTLDQLLLILKSQVGVELMDYIENRLNNIPDGLKDYEYNFLLDEIYNSIITWSFLSEIPNVSSNIPYLMDNMSYISYPIEMSPTYNLLLFYKPYHVELIKRLSEVIRDDKNTRVITDLTYGLFIKLFQASAFNISNYIEYKIKFQPSAFSTISINNEFDFTVSSIDYMKLFRSVYVNINDNAYISKINKLITDNMTVNSDSSYSKISFKDFSASGRNFDAMQYSVKMTDFSGAIRINDLYDISMIEKHTNNYTINHNFQIIEHE